MATPGLEYAVLVELNGLCTVGRGTDKEVVIANAAAQFRDYFKVSPATPVTAQVIDCSGYGPVHWQAGFFYADDQKIDRPIEVLEV